LTVGQAQLTEDLVLDIYLSPGTSGSAVLDEHGNMLGMIILTGTLKLASGSLTSSVAIPVRTIAKALVDVDPIMGSTTFCDIPAEAPKSVQTRSLVYVEDELPGDISPVIPELSAIPVEVPEAARKMRAQSEATSKVMVDIIARQCLAQGAERPLCHELSVVDGRQRFREINKNGKLGRLVDSFPIQKHGVWVQTDWADTASEIADDPWQFQGIVNDYYLFTLRATAADDRCYWEEYSQGFPLFGGGHSVWKGSVDCFEQVLTDKEFNVVSMFTEMYPPNNCMVQSVQTAIYYERVKLEGIESLILLPVMERISTKVQGQNNVLYANVLWTNYEKFRVQHIIEY